MKNQLLKEAEMLQDELSAWRRSLHQIPELGLSLPQTLHFVCERLDEMGVSYQVHDSCSCITALIGTGEPCFMLRSDMDALPLEEESGEPFSSCNHCMHACGHDLHTAILLGACKLLKMHESQLQGTVKLLFQSGEEVFTGAKAAIECNVLENPSVEAAFAMHVASTVKVNAIIYGASPMASVYGFRIKLTGKGCHGSSPSLGIDPINTGVHIYLALQELIAREISSTEEAALTFGRFSSGSASNIIPETAVLEGTLRTFNPELASYLIQRIHDVTDSIAAAYRTAATIECLSNVPSVQCDKAVMEQAVNSIHSLDDTLQTFPLYHVMGSEDFAFFSEKIPSAYLGIGAGIEDSSSWLSQHNPGVRFHEGCLHTGAAIYAQVALDYLASRAVL